MPKSGRGEPGWTDMKGSLFQDFILHYEAGSREGSAVLYGRGAGGAAPGLLYTQLIRDNFVRRKRQDGADIIAHMMKGFAVLELICVNLFLYPWRKEIRTLKKFTGNFVYFVEPVIPEKTVRQILQQVGYSVVTETEYIIGGTINIEEAKLTAFELYLARLHCEKLLCLIKENRSDCADLLFSELNLEIKNEKENSEQCRKRNSQIANPENTNDTNNLNVQTKIFKNIHRKDSKKSATGFGLPTAQHRRQDDSTVDSNYFLSRHLDSDEFLTKYSDLNLAQQPLVPLQNRKTYINPRGLKEEISDELFEKPKFSKAGIPESSSNELEPDLYKARDLVYSVPVETTDAGPTIIGHNTLDSKKPLDINMSPMEMNVPNQQTQSERLVIKLKMGKTADEMAYPVEETLPPDPKEFSYSSQFCPRDPKWTCLQSREAMEEVTGSASFSSGFSTLNATTGNGAECVGVDNLHRLREPPSSMYIPPEGTMRQCLRITDLQPEENHYQAPSLPDMVQVNETLFKVLEDTKEDFVMITKNQQP
ncbi:uncharacterized protein [Aquarana catesbeiana]|uniref:uncharacterized protein n=1 Tax=Aquarana catesbeiana TaxID=8400 RepID=UPI003CCA30E7